MQFDNLVLDSTDYIVVEAVENVRIETRCQH